MNHISDHIKTPKIIQLKRNLYLARFESMKIYSTLAAVERLLNSNTIDENTTLIDSSSGIYAYALAIACHKFSLKCHIVASKTVDSSVRVQLELLGAKVDGVPNAGSLKLDQKYRVEKIKEILKKEKDYYWMKQYHDDIHYDGYHEFADLVDRKINTNNITIIGGVGSGCSTGGLASSLRNNGKKVKLCGIQPFGSMTFGAENIDDPEIVIAGIGSAIEFNNVKHHLYDSLNWVSFNHSLSGSVDLMKKHAIFAGLSTGAAWCVGLQEYRNEPNTPTLIISPDTGHRYVDSVFNRHNEAYEIESLRPKIINRSEELELPWSQYNWDHQEKSALKNF